MTDPLSCPIVSASYAHSTIAHSLFANHSYLVLLPRTGTAEVPNDAPGESILCKEPKRPRPGYGMSPKKDHEVARMSAFVSGLLKNCSRLRGVRHLVDVGAGQVCTLFLLFISGTGIRTISCFYELTISFRIFKHVPFLVVISLTFIDTRTLCGQWISISCLFSVFKLVLFQLRSGGHMCLCFTLY